jgi:hypothetical protein
MVTCPASVHGLPVAAQCTLCNGCELKVSLKTCTGALTKGAFHHMGKKFKGFKLKSRTAVRSVLEHSPE